MSIHHLAVVLRKPVCLLSGHNHHIKGRQGVRWALIGAWRDDGRAAGARLWLRHAWRGGRAPASLSGHVHSAVPLCRPAPPDDAAPRLSLGACAV
ncbi:unnamed protein product, partial [Iphiclides podalirius]